MVKLLALAPQHRVHRDQVVEWLWPDAELAAATNSLNQVLHVARRALAPEAPRTSGFLHIRGEILSLSTHAPVLVNVATFESAAAVARAAGTLTAYQAAVDRYTGDILPDDLYSDWAAGRRDTLRHEYLTLLLDLARLYEDEREPGKAITALRRAVTADPALEEAHVLLMRVLRGRRPAAPGAAAVSRAAGGTASATWRSSRSRTAGACTRILNGRFPVAARPVSPAGTERDSGPQATGNGAAPPTNLPAELTSFIGRERERLRWRGCWGRPALLTLTGAGGCGKTRLALQVAAELVRSSRTASGWSSWRR